MPRRLPPLNAVRAFEASARLGGFVAAAAELGVTPAAVSLQVRKLEEHYGTRLFRRLPSGVDLTETGAAIQAECAAALATLEAAGGLLSSREARTRIVLSCVNSLAHRWLAPRLSRLSAAAPEHWIELRAEADPVDFGAGGADLRITYGEQLYPEHETRPLFTDALVPLGTPEFLTRAGIAPGSPSNLRDEHLIQTWWSPSFRAYPTWADWFSAAGAPRVPRAGAGPATNMPALAVDMALQGMGVALAQLSLTSGERARRELVAPVPVPLVMPQPYALVVPRAAGRRGRVAQVVAWLMAEVATLDPFLPGDGAGRGQ